ncbi:hypothetical protein Psta_4626 [Pirellula staleyi DSM 6068]|uniref:Uncharacterized protein n=1 Tax=Pirellula staleyi (strain ATCC 27377 / DSM 6068 / ICPB 4128) TaxID=530564 RepID=D2R765_PIRSD|nr:HlyD family efflux transporter periplasmic adaptor subunit [Pirellula staleyi]ADB19268.1 hypothetical protein Psta_4626 [Pirellula staleyi DSM 6068]
MSWKWSVVLLLLVLSIGASLGWLGGTTRGQQLLQSWRAAANSPSASDDHGTDSTADAAAHGPEIKRLKLTEQARKNLQLQNLRLTLGTFWQTVEMPGLVIDRPGVSDRGVVAPISGTITEIHAFPGADVEPGAKLFTIRLVSESLHAAQLELFKATSEIGIAERDRKRLEGLATSGALPQSRIIEIDNQIARMQVAAEAYRQDLASRGIAASDIDAAARGQFLSEITVQAPMLDNDMRLASTSPDQSTHLTHQLEVESLEVELGQQVNAGEVLCHLANHRYLMVEGRGFKSDLAVVREVSGKQMNVTMDISTPGGDGPMTWPEPLQISRLASDLDAESRTFAFYLPLENRTSLHDWHEGSKTDVVVRPGMRVRLRLPLSPIENVLIVPREAVARSGGEALIYRQNGEWFDELPVQIVAENRHQIAIAPTETIRPGWFIASNHAASLLRIRKSQASSGESSGVHVHADGSVHGAH